MTDKTYPGMGGILTDVFSELVRRKANPTATLLVTEAKKDILKELKKKLTRIGNEHDKAMEVIRNMRLIFGNKTSVTEAAKPKVPKELDDDGEMDDGPIKVRRQKEKNILRTRLTPDAILEKYKPLEEIVENQIPALERIEKELSLFPKDPVARKMRKQLDSLRESIEEDLEEAEKSLEEVAEKGIPSILRSLGQTVAAHLDRKINQPNMKLTVLVAAGVPVKTRIRYVYYIILENVKDQKGKTKDLWVAIYTDLDAGGDLDNEGRGLMGELRMDAGIGKYDKPNKLRGDIVQKPPKPEQKAIKSNRALAFIDAFLLDDARVSVSDATTPKLNMKLFTSPSAEYKRQYPVLEFIVGKPKQKANSVSITLDWDALKDAGLRNEDAMIKLREVVADAANIPWRSRKKQAHRGIERVVPKKLKKSEDTITFNFSIRPVLMRQRGQGFRKPAKQDPLQDYLKRAKMKEMDEIRKELLEDEEKARDIMDEPEPEPTKKKQAIEDKEELLRLKKSEEKKKKEKQKALKSREDRFVAEMVENGFEENQVRSILDGDVDDILNDIDEGRLDISDAQNLLNEAAEKDIVSDSVYNDMVDALDEKAVELESLEEEKDEIDEIPEIEEDMEIDDFGDELDPSDYEID